MSEILPNAIMIRIEGKSESAKFTKSHIVTLLAQVFEQTAPPSTKKRNELMYDLLAMKKNHPYCLMGDADKFSDMEFFCRDAPTQEIIITTGVSTEGGILAVSIKDTSSLFPM